MASEVSICNLALFHLGVATISALTENTKAANACLAVYEETRDQLLRRYPWNFAVARATLAALSSPVPDYDYEAYFALPAACLRVLSVKDDPEYKVEGRMIASNITAPLYIKYVSKVTDANTMDPLFRAALAARLAFLLAPSFTDSVGKREAASNAYKAAILEAYAADGVEDSPEYITTDPWLDARVISTPYDGPLYNPIEGL